MIAINIIKSFCNSNNYILKCILSIGGGEAILKTPFKFLITKKLKKLSKSIEKKNNILLQVTFPLPKRIYLLASTRYWVNYGKKNNLKKEDLATLKI